MKILSITLEYTFKSKLDDSMVTTKAKFVRRKRQGEKDFMKKVNRIIKSRNAKIIEKEMI